MSGPSSICVLAPAAVAEDVTAGRRWGDGGGRRRLPGGFGDVVESVEMLTSGNVPLEKTLGGQQSARALVFAGRQPQAAMAGDGGGREGGDSHQQAGLTTGTVAYNDQLSTDFRHGDEG
jgi:hypothetical protein